MSSSDFPPLDNFPPNPETEPEPKFDFDFEPKATEHSQVYSHHSHGESDSSDKKGKKKSFFHRLKKRVFSSGRRSYDTVKNKIFFFTLAGVLTLLVVFILMSLTLNRCSASQPTISQEEESLPEIVQETSEPNPIDFDALHKKNEDIYAWISIPGTRVDYPVLQNEKDDSYYLNRNAEKKRSINGSLFTQATYNSTDFNDPVTVIYGHKMLSGAMFGTLQKQYSKGLNGIDRIIITLPKEQITYQVFAALPYDNRHLLYHLDFENPNVFNDFLETIYSARALGAQINSDIPVKAGDKLLILSTCLQGNRQKRFLVIAKQISKQNFQ